MNPLHTRWYAAWQAATYPLRLLGFRPCLVRCHWTKAHCRVGLVWAGWGA